MHPVLAFPARLTPLAAAALIVLGATAPAPASARPHRERVRVAHVRIAHPFRHHGRHRRGDHRAAGHRHHVAGVRRHDLHRRLDAPGLLGGPLSASFVNGGGFLGAPEASCCVDPPEISGAASSTQVVQIDANNITVFDRSTGKKVSQAALSSFCSPLTGAPQVRIVYDWQASRWLLIGLGDASQPAPLCLGASQGPNAAGSWALAALPTLEAPGHFAANPMIGYDEDAAYITWEDHDSSTGAFTSASLFSVSMWRLLTGTGFSSFFFSGEAGPLAPPIVEDSSDPSVYFLAASPSGNALTMLKGTQLNRASAQLEGHTVTVPSYTSPPPAPLPGTTDTLDAGHASFTQPSIQIGHRLLNIHGEDFGGRDGARWYEIDTTDNTLARNGRLTESSTSDDFMPTMSASGAGATGDDPVGTMFFTWSTTNTRSSTPSLQHGLRTALAVRTQSGPLNLHPQATYNSQADYDPAPGGTNGWGVSQVSLDPLTATGCDFGNRAVAVAPQAKSAQLWRGRVFMFGTC